MPVREVDTRTSVRIRRGLGVTAGLDAGLARDFAWECARLGYHSLWSNDEPTASGLATLAHFAAAAPELELGAGILPIDRHRPVHVAAEIHRLGLDPARLWVGVGSGQLHSPTRAVENAVAELREILPDGTRIVVAAMRPNMCRLGGAIADCVLLNWMLPDRAATARRWVREGAVAAGRAAPVSLRTSASRSGSGRSSDSATRRAATAPRTTTIASISPPWTSSSEASAWRRPRELKCWMRLPPTTPRSTCPSHGCSPIPTPPRCAPSQLPPRREYR